MHARLPARTLALPAAAAAGAAFLLLPQLGRGFVLTTDVLALAQRDFRVFDSFADPSANDNTVEHPSFPGWTGAELAIWKASVEWGSRLHGDGQGDPHQPDGLGSGSANFDAWFRGAAPGMGTTNDNIHAAIASLPGGVLAVTETPTSDGWRILYNDTYVWSDGPDASVPAGQVDLQAIATHEYGHALGLGHTSVIGATMSATAPGDMISLRSIEADDVAGVQAVYGAVAPAKPIVASAAVVGGQLLISGSGFAPTGAEIWLTDAVAANVATFGVYAALPLPPGAGSGDVLVRNPGTSGAALSNAYPIDVTPPCGAQVYGIGLGGANVGSLASASAPSPGGAFVLDLQVLGPGPVALVALGPKPGVIGMLGGKVLLDLGQPLFFRSAALVGGAGQLVLGVPSDPTLAGAEICAQAGALDPAQIEGIALTNGLALRVCP